MNLPELGNASMVAGIRLFLAAVSPLQELFDHPGITHEFCNSQALTILHNDGFDAEYQFLSAYSAQINAGVYWADKGWKNVNHYLDPLTARGLWQFQTAMDDFSRYYWQAIYQARGGIYDKAAFYLGAAAHLVQDVCVPHHARARLFSGHKEYESWARENFRAYAIDKKGLYQERAGVKRVMTNALIAADFFEAVNLDNGNMNYHQVSTVLLPLAQRSTAGLFREFCAEISANLSDDLPIFTVA